MQIHFRSAKAMHGLLVAAIGFSSACGGGNRNLCDDIQTTKGPFGSQRIFSMRYNWGKIIQLVEKDGKRFIVLMPVAAGMVRESIPPGAKVRLALGSSIVELRVADETAPRHNATGSGIYTIWELRIPITASQLSDFANKSLRGVSITVGANEIESALDQDEMTEFTQGARCMATPGGAIR
ncbi:MAG: hypothetical protein HY902_15850 [Deltaproteobacteria bacterium]|nr:hypothetical protein [Deltaproteobacteria bacterium]